MSLAPLLTLSIVSHGQGALVARLLADIRRQVDIRHEIVLTLNIAEDEAFLAPYLGTLPLRVLRNQRPKGFGANHNIAFEQARSSFFVVVNPDIRLPRLELDRLTELFGDSTVGACAPKVLNSAGAVEDNARRFPTFGRLLRRVVSRPAALDYEWGGEPAEVDWVAGMFIVFRAQAFSEVGGFDARRFFMYYEDVDVCDRLRQRGWKVMIQPATSVVHDAQRASHRSFRHLRWHVTSALRYLTGR